MKIYKTPEEMIRARIKLLGSVGLIPTMGALHEGHLSLIKQSQMKNDSTIVSIFVNPTQFDNQNDLKTYPNLLESDLEKLQHLDVEMVFLPSFENIYPDKYSFSIQENKLSTKLCGLKRPGHFDGVLTIVMKLLQITKADDAYFGEKDYQQYLLIKQMAEAFFLTTKINPCPIFREQDGLAMSSRNLNLSKDARKKAPFFYKTLKSQLSKIQMEKELNQNGFKVDYIEEIDNRRYGAVFIDNVRLIDNVEI